MADSKRRAPDYVLLAVTLALLPHPPDPIHVSDKAKHMAAFGTLTLLAAMSRKFRAAAPMSAGA